LFANISTASSPPNLTASRTINVANVAIIDDESMSIEESRTSSEVPLSDQQPTKTNR
jgi:hypothetical protein